MDHLMPINQPFYQRERSHKTNLSPKASYAFKDTSGRAPGANDIYVGHIPIEVDSNTLARFFSQFGEIERIFEGKKIPPGGMKWAFISYIHPEDSCRYIESLCFFWVLTWNQALGTSWEDCHCRFNTVPFHVRQRYLILLVTFVLVTRHLLSNVSANVNSINLVNPIAIVKCPIP